uniref:Uncharacterized protein n=1 Tax=Glossina palpalis gambiensis TaxID=67801 RepID=A0A1B0C743_9MUSC
MSNGRLLLKRKLSTVSLDHSSDSEDIPSSKAKKNENDDEKQSVDEQQLYHCDTPPPEPVDYRTLPLDSDRHLLDIIRAKISELQHELNDCESDFDDQSVAYDNPRSVDSQGPIELSEQDAEALGFATCAQETFLFLQREGISTDSPLFTRLRDVLVGHTENDQSDDLLN